MIKAEPSYPTDKALEYWKKAWGDPNKVKVYEGMFEKHTKVKAKFCTGNVLELGCGTGVAGKYIMNYTGVDFSQEGLDEAKRKCPHGTYHCIDLGKPFKLPYPDNHFETVLMSEIVEHLEDFSHLLAEVGRVGKRYVISVPQNLYAEDHHWPIWKLTDIENVFGRLGEIVHVAKTEGNFWIVIIEKDKNKYYIKINV